MQNVSLGVSLREKSVYFLGKTRFIFEMSSAEIFTQHAQH